MTAKGALESAETKFVEQYLTNNASAVASFCNSIPVCALIPELDKFPKTLKETILFQLSPQRVQELFQSDLAAARPILATLKPEQIILGLQVLSNSSQAEVLKDLPSPLRIEVKNLMHYPPDSAGALMKPVALRVNHAETVQAAAVRLKNLGQRKLLHLHVTDLNGKYLGRVSVHDLLISPDDLPLGELIESGAVSVNEMMNLEDMAEVIEKKWLTSVPVVDRENILLGIIHYEDILGLIQKDSALELQKMWGGSGDEQALSKPFYATKKRLPWLCINLLTTFVAASVVAIFEGVIAQVTALAVLLPVVAGQSGNTGAQAQAVTLRGLVLREIKLRNKWQMLRKELRVGLINGLAIGALVGISVAFWGNSIALGLVIAGAMVLSMVAASASGTLIPMILVALGQDPATSSSIILTTITDVVGFFSFLGLAYLALSYLPVGVS